MKEILLASVDTYLQVILITSIFQRFRVNNVWFESNNRDFLPPRLAPWEKKETIPSFVLPILHLAFFGAAYLGNCFSLGHPLIAFYGLHLLSCFHPFRPAAVMLLRQHEIAKMDSCCFPPFNSF